MKNSIFSLWAVLLLPAFASAQSLGRVVVGSAGQLNRHQAITLEWTLGEAAVAAYSYPGGKLSEGFHQPETGILQSHPLLPAVPGTSDFRTFPNPATTSVRIQSNLETSGRVDLLLLSAQGQVLERQPVASGSINEELNLEPYPTGIFNLVIRDHSGRILRSTRIIKH